MRRRTDLDLEATKYYGSTSLHDARILDLKAREYYSSASLRDARILISFSIYQIKMPLRISRVTNAQRVGDRSYQEDTFDHYTYNKEWEGFAVFDGHGSDEVSTLLKEACLQFLQPYMTPIGRLQQGIFALDRMLRERIKNFDAGSTACIVLINKLKDFIVVINLGDSRVIVWSMEEGRQVYASNDHKPDSPQERKRIESLGGTIKEATKQSVARIDGLALSRCFGDFKLKQGKGSKKEYDPEAPVSTRADVDQVQILSPTTLILATDGLWDNVTPSQIPRLFECKTAEDVARHYPSSDNMTIIMICLEPVVAKALPSYIWRVEDTQRALFQSIPRSLLEDHYREHYQNSNSSDPLYHLFKSLLAEQLSSAARPPSSQRHTSRGKETETAAQAWIEPLDTQAEFVSAREKGPARSRRSKSLRLVQTVGVDRLRYGTFSNL